MNILVTGGAGFIGSHVVRRLLEEGHTVHVVDNLSGGQAENVPAEAVLHVMDIRDDTVEALFARERFPVMIHLAAQMDVRKSVEDPFFDADVNVLGFLNLIEAGRKNGLQQVIFSSTGGAIYGEPEYTPQDETHPLRPLSPYGITKLITEKYLLFYWKTYKILPVILRYANVYGPGQRSGGEAGVVAIFTRQMLNGQAPIIYGDGTQSRDYVYVDDVVEANMQALHSSQAGTYNVGTGLETSVNTLFDSLRRVIGVSVEPTYGARREGEQQRSVLAVTRIQTALGWSPRVNLLEGLDKTRQWFKSRIPASS